MGATVLHVSKQARGWICLQNHVVRHHYIHTDRPTISEQESLALNLFTPANREARERSQAIADKLLDNVFDVVQPVIQQAIVRAIHLAQIAQSPKVA